jgi:hypothetical protein
VHPSLEAQAIAHVFDFSGVVQTLFKRLPTIVGGAFGLHEPMLQEIVPLLRKSHEGGGGTSELGKFALEFSHAVPEYRVRLKGLGVVPLPVPPGPKRPQSPTETLGWSPDPTERMRSERKAEDLHTGAWMGRLVGKLEREERRDEQDGRGRQLKRLQELN